MIQIYLDGKYLENGGQGLGSGGTPIGSSILLIEWSSMASCEVRDTSMLGPLS